MKFKIKAFDNTSDRSALIEKVNNFLYDLYSEKDNFTGMHMDQDGSQAIIFNIQFNWKIEDTFYVSIIWPIKGDFNLVSKTKYGEYEPFIKEELRFFDSLDFEIYHPHYTVLKQDIADWVTM